MIEVHIRTYLARKQFKAFLYGITKIQVISRDEKPKLSFDNSRFELSAILELSLLIIDLVPFKDVLASLTI